MLYSQVECWIWLKIGKFCFKTDIEWNDVGVGVEKEGFRTID